jgi:hypothetical protein
VTPWAFVLLVIGVAFIFTGVSMLGALKGNDERSR